MFRSLVESIRAVVAEGEGYVDKYDKYARISDRYGKRSGKRKGISVPLKQATSRLSRREARRKLKSGNEDDIRTSVVKGYAS